MCCLVIGTRMVLIVNKLGCEDKMLCGDIIDIHFATTELLDVMNDTWVNKLLIKTLAKAVYPFQTCYLYCIYCKILSQNITTLFGAAQNVVFEIAN